MDCSLPTTVDGEEEGERNGFGLILGAARASLLRATY